MDFETRFRTGGEITFVICFGRKGTLNSKTIYMKTFLLTTPSTLHSSIKSISKFFSKTYEHFLQIMYLIAQSVIRTFKNL